jgi:CheY-like chemotaxis protein
MARPPLLIVEDELDLRRLMAEPLKPWFDVVEAADIASAVGALDFITELRLVVSDNCLRLGRGGLVETGVDLHRRIKSILIERSGVMIVSTGGDYALQQDYFEAEGIRVFHKPYSVRRELLPCLAQFAGIEL